MSRTPVFDIGDTLLPSRRFASNVIQDELRRANDGDVPEYDPDKFLMYDQDQVAEFLEENDLEGDPRMLAEKSRDRYLESFEALLLEKDVFDFLARCSSEFGEVGFISDNTVRAKQLLSEKLRKHSVEFDTVVVSDEVGVEKPDPEIFREFVDRRGGSPNEYVYIGNDARRDAAAKEIGMEFVWMTAYDSFGSYSGVRIEDLSFESLKSAMKRLEA